MIVVYPVARLLAQPKLFNALANYLEGPDAETLRSTFYDLIELEFDEKEADECFFEAEEAYFEVDEEGGELTIQLDNGVACKMTPNAEAVNAQISNDSQLAASSAVYQKLVSTLEESYPEYEGDIALCSPPTPGNNFLSSRAGNFFEGSFHLKSNPDKKFAFNIVVINADSEEMQATIRPM